MLTLVPEETSDQCPEWVARQFSYDQWSLPFLTDLNPSFFQALRRILSRESVDVVHLSTGVCAAKLIGMFESETTVVYAAQNVEADHARDFVDPDLPIHKRLLGPRLIPAIEWATVHCADRVTTVSEKDRDQFVERYGLADDSVWAVPTGTIPINSSDLRPQSDVREQLGVGDRPLIAFHGHYGHQPNHEAAESIDKRIAPALRERDVDAEFLLIGKDPPSVSSPNVHAVGFVDDLHSVLNAADVAAVPIRHGGGTKTKLYDYVSLALPIVATEKAIEGVDIEPERHGLIVDEVGKEFVSRLLTLVQQPSVCERLSENLATLAKEWRWDRSADRLEQAYGKLL